MKIHLRLSAKRVLVGLMASLAIAVSGLQLQAQTPSLDVYYDKLDPKDSFKYKWKGVEKTCNVGAFLWEVPESEFSTGGLDRNFTGYCAEIHVPITAGKTYRFRQISLLEPSSYGLEATPEGMRAAERRATLIRELFGRYYTMSKTANPEDTFAFQIALWELTHETEPMDRAISFDLFSGDFQANYPRAQAPSYVLKAQAYLDSLTGNDAVYYENPNMNGRELIRLEGIPNAEGIVAQSQYALRYIDGGAPGVGAFSRMLGNTGGGGFGGIGGGGGGSPLLGTDTGGGGPLIGGPDSSTSTTTPNGSTTGQPTTSHSRVPAGGPSTAVPAPAGLVLGLLAVGALASRRAYMKWLNR